MGKRTYIAGVALILAIGLSVMLFSSSSPRAAQRSAEDWSRLTVVTYASGLTGFFDPKTGKLYVYDSDLANCYAIMELTELGEPMKKIKN